MRVRVLLIALMALLLAAPALAADRLVLATTTSTANTGLLDVLLPAFSKQSGITVHYIPVGTGKALAIAKRCDADLVIVHAPALEKRFVADGYGVDREPLMHNYFVLVGPPGDPAKVKQAANVQEAFRRIAEAKAPFLSRGDNSGTQVKELSLWKAAGIKPNWPAYREAGRGMGPTLTMADELGSYTLSDIATYRKYLSTGRINLVILADKQELLKNPYSMILVNPAKCPKVKYAQAKKFEEFLLSPQGQKIIGEYKADGKKLFWPIHPPKP
ncbi:MAG: substrate-binding domain-containing protein [Deltaproteobacteria bacterium]|nr:substrate-binding domain-containing protein [Deltaproteobacteria bacterium]